MTERQSHREKFKLFMHNLRRGIKGVDMIYLVGLAMAGAATGVLFTGFSTSPDGIFAALGGAGGGAILGFSSRRV